MGNGSEFEFTVDGQLIYSNQTTGEYLGIKILTQAVVDAIEPRATA
jgi:predicted Rdx family selenoprotein